MNYVKILLWITELAMFDQQLGAQVFKDFNKAYSDLNKVLVLSSQFFILILTAVIWTDMCL